MCFSQPKIPTVPAATQTPTEADPAVQAAMEGERKRRSALGGFRSTILSSGKGVPSLPSAPKKLFGE